MPTSSSVRRVLRGTLCRSGGGRQAVTINLIFTANEPSAIRASIRLGFLTQERTELILPAQLLEAGLTRPARVGYVSIGPSLFGPAPVVRIRLADGVEDLLIELPAEEVAEFLYWIRRLVPRPPQCPAFETQSPVGQLVWEAS
jgi:Streptomyces sporulation and cell division protein, SsgA